jgi:hypothetical protein
VVVVVVLLRGEGGGGITLRISRADVARRGTWVDGLVALVEYLQCGESWVGFLVKR